MKQNPLTSKLDYYRECLAKNEQAMYYLKRRGIDQSGIDEYMLGYCPVKRGTSMLEGRILFPLTDVTGEVLTYQGRALNPKTRPKYYHSRTDYYNKARHIYGLAQIAIRNPRPKQIVLFEGPVDVVLLYQMGIDAVCTFGTSLSPEHAFTLSSVCKRFILSYDNDETGKMAAENAKEILKPFKVESKIILTPGGMKDWGEFREAYGRKETKKEATRCYAI